MSYQIQYYIFLLISPFINLPITNLPVPLTTDLHVHFFLMICNLMYEERVACYKATKDPEYHPMFPSLLPSSELHSLYVLFQPLLSQIKHKLLSMKLNDPSIPAVFNALQFFHSSFYNQQNDNSLARARHLISTS